MTGDRLKELEDGFLEGSLSDQEEVELRQYVLEQSAHPLRPYFLMTLDQEMAEVPDLRQVVGSKRSVQTNTWLKVAAALIILAVAGFLLEDRISGSQPDSPYSQVEIDRSYEATMETLSAMAKFLDNGLKDTQQCMDMSEPFKQLNELKNENSK